MKKLSYVLLAAFVVCGFWKMAHADNTSYGWQNGNGGVWGTPPACGNANQPLIGDGNCNAKTASQTNQIAIPSDSTTTINGLTPTIGSIVFCSAGCTHTTICVATGTVAGIQSWVGVNGSTFVASGFLSAGCN